MSLSAGFADCILARGAVLDELLYNHSTAQPAEQHCNTSFLLSSCSFAGSHLIFFIHVNVAKNRAASACRTAPFVPFVRGLQAAPLSPLSISGSCVGKSTFPARCHYELGYRKGHHVLNITDIL